jgi:stage II sporulation protein R
MNKMKFKGELLMSRILPTIRGLDRIYRIGNILKISLTLLITIAIVFSLFIASYSENLNAGLSNALIRLHVIANSDSPSDQALKRSVRDVIITYMKDQLKDSKDLEQTKNIINSDKESIVLLAKDEIKKNGYDYDVNVTLGSYPFPTKTYGDISLPAGNYQALRVVIGKGEGANWWCVLFPPLCFVDVTHGTVPDSVKEDLKRTLTNEEYSIITSADSDEDIPIKIKFKIVEFFQDSKMTFAGVMNKIFNTHR